MSVITESEKKRLRSLKEKKQAFKAKRLIIHQALSNLDNTTNSKKIIFDDFDEGQPLKSRKRDLFDSDDDNNDEKDSLWSEKVFKVKKSKKVTLGNDARFTLDDRFMEDNCDNEESKVVNGTSECELQKEKERQLDILEGILGMPLTVKSQENQPVKKGLMIRYDPTENGHCEYEIKPAQPETKEKNSRKKKSDKSVSEIGEPAPPEPEVSQDIYYTVSDVLTESLKQKEEFSLLKTHGKETDDTESTRRNNTFIVENNKAQKFKFNFNANNAFKYDSSDDEDIHKVPDIDDEMVDEAKEDTQQKSLFGHKDTLFLDNNDVRFNEAIKFFSTEAATNGEFNNLRRELKTIVRMKIRNNERRHQPYGKKRKIKKFQ
ncbi:PREDICTED: probable RNA-binding protein CG14230 [Vollenhovia emeryi]|uniref:probable RNA-binding protein CG14230 n=1 Tax=Vollenhovia emeryi TaxID=411798 RepID=UPI0005F3C2AC|nr:PREDICTED: probable RNA-binding protein CG14230 [Vollenhovia emeryi]XP_011860507.1 PREDICTED: probable RNA-binding protein CG14230 [Vollenhovia emeryi]